MTKPADPPVLTAAAIRSRRRWRPWARLWLSLTPVKEQNPCSVRPTFSVNTWSERWPERPSRTHQHLSRHALRMRQAQKQEVRDTFIGVAGMLLAVLGGVGLPWAVLKSAPGWEALWGSLGILGGWAIAYASLALHVLNHYRRSIEPRLANWQRVQDRHAKAYPVTPPSLAQRQALRALGMPGPLAHWDAVCKRGDAWCVWDQEVWGNAVLFAIREALDPLRGQPRIDWALAVLAACPELTQDAFVSVLQHVPAQDPDGTHVPRVLALWGPMAKQTSGATLVEQVFEQWSHANRTGQSWPDAWKQAVLDGWTAHGASASGLPEHRPSANVYLRALEWKSLAEDLPWLEALHGRAPHAMPLALLVSLRIQAQLERPLPFADRYTQLEETQVRDLLLAFLWEALPPEVGTVMNRRSLRPPEEQQAWQQIAGLWASNVPEGQLWEWIWAWATARANSMHYAIIQGTRGEDKPTWWAWAAIEVLSPALPLSVQETWLKRLTEGRVPALQARVRAHQLNQRPATLTPRSRPRA